MCTHFLGFVFQQRGSRWVVAGLACALFWTLAKYVFFCGAHAHKQTVIFKSVLWQQWPVKSTENWSFTKFRCFTHYAFFTIRVYVFFLRLFLAWFLSKFFDENWQRGLWTKCTSSDKKKIATFLFLALPTLDWELIINRLLID